VLPHVVVVAKTNETVRHRSSVYSSLLQRTHVVGKCRGVVNE